MRHLKKTPAILTMLFMFLAAILSCSKSSNNDDTNVCDSVTNKSYAANVDPIIQTYCNQAGCHGPGSINGPGPLTNYTEVFNARAAVRAAIASGLMPQNATLTTAQRNSIICWIDSGAPNN